MYQPVKRDLNGVPKFCYTTWVPGTVLGCFDISMLFSFLHFEMAVFGG